MNDQNISTQNRIAKNLNSQNNQNSKKQNSGQSGEYIQAKSIAEYWQKLKTVYLQKSKFFEEISKEDYEAIDKSEREDSDNHYNQERLGKDSDVVDVAFYKYLPDQQTCYRIHIVDINGQQEEHYFKLTLHE